MHRLLRGQQSTILSALCCALLIAIPILPGGKVAAAAPANKGLRISPLYQYIKVTAGSPTTGNFTISDQSDGPMAVTLSVQQFSVANYTYDYRFSQPGNDWLKLGLTQTTLQPGQSQQITYSLNTPVSASPGGYYYTLLASTNLSGNSIDTTVQAATLLYVTVNGKLIETGRIQRASIPRLSFGKQINYSVDALNTGNVYYFSYFSGSIHGLFTDKSSEPTTSLLMPNHVRNITGSIPAPWLPGIYRATYGYKTDSGVTVTRSRSIVVIPLWFIALLLIIVLLGGKLRRSKSKKPKTAI